MSQHMTSDGAVLQLATRLGEIHQAAGRRRRRARHSRAAANRTRSGQILKALEFVGEVEELAASLAGDLVQELSLEAELSRRFFDGCYTFSLRANETLVDREGRIVERMTGAKPRRVLERRIRELLGLEV